MRTLAAEANNPITFIHLNKEEERQRLRGYDYDKDYVEFDIQLATIPAAAGGIILPTVEENTGHPAHAFSSVDAGAC